MTLIAKIVHPNSRTSTSYFSLSCIGFMTSRNPFSLSYTRIYVNRIAFVYTCSSTCMSPRFYPFCYPSLTSHLRFPPAFIPSINISPGFPDCTQIDLSPLFRHVSTVLPVSVIMYSTVSTISCYIHVILCTFSLNLLVIISMRHAGTGRS